MRFLYFPVSFFCFLTILLAAIACASSSFAHFKKPMHSVFGSDNDFDFVPPPPGSYSLPIIKKAPNGDVLDIKGDQLSLKSALGGKISIVSFVYLSCGDTEGCPLAISTLFELFHKSEGLEDLNKFAQLVTISFDPARDTVGAIEAFSVPIMADIGADRKIRWSVFTTKSSENLEPILDGYGQMITHKRNSNIINHLLRIYLVDSRGYIRNIYGLGTIDPRLLVTDIETLLIEEGKR